MKVYVICHIPAQLPNLEKIWFLRYEQSDCRIFKSDLFLEQPDDMAGFFHDDTIQILGYQKLIEQFWGRCGQK